MEEGPPPPAHELRRLPEWERDLAIERATRPAPWSLALIAVREGHLSGRAIARFLRVSESALRLWRKRTPAFDAELSDLIAAECERHAAEDARLEQAECLAQMSWRERIEHDLANGRARGVIIG